MKRDMDLCRQLLLKVEALEPPAGEGVYLPSDDPFFFIDGYNYSQIIYNFALLCDIGFLVAPTNMQSVGAYGIMGLSWAGHEFLDTIRSPEIWKATKDTAKKAGGVGMDLLLQIAKAEGKRFITTHLGLPL